MEGLSTITTTMLSSATPQEHLKRYLYQLSYKPSSYTRFQKYVSNRTEIEGMQNDRQKQRHVSKIICGSESIFSKHPCIIVQLDIDKDSKVED